MTPNSIVQINWPSLVEKNAGFAIAFAILIITGILGYAIIKMAAKQISTLQDLISNHMQHTIEAQKELIVSIKEHRREASAAHDKMMTRHDKALECIFKIKGKVGA